MKPFQLTETNWALSGKTRWYRSKKHSKETSELLMYKLSKVTGKIIERLAPHDPDDSVATLPYLIGWKGNLKSYNSWKEKPSLQNRQRIID